MEPETADIPPETAAGNTSSGTTPAPPASTDQPEPASASGQPQANKNSKASADEGLPSDTITERGAKIKWPAKRMSVADMNKRVRALVEWVGREQALSHDRERRRASLEAALHRTKEVNGVEAEAASTDRSTNKMAVDGNIDSGLGAGGAEFASAPKPSTGTDAVPPRSSTPRSMFAAGLPNGLGANGRMSTTKMMEELMEELINFQERFGPGAKGAIREKRAAAVT